MIRLITGVATLGFMAGAVLPQELGPEQEAQERLLYERDGPLNPHGYPRMEPCDHIALNDPVAEANANIAKGDLRPFRYWGFIPPDAIRAPGIVCIKGSNYHYDFRGGILVGDMPACHGSYDALNAPPDKMEAYNRVLASNPRFQRLTGCHPAPIKIP